jgi:hypothetical protein
LFKQSWAECPAHKVKKEFYQKELEELKTIIPLMNKKKKKSVEEKVKDLHITSDLTYKRKIEMIKDNKPVIINQQPYILGQPMVKPKRMFRIKRGEGNKLIFQKISEKEEGLNVENRGSEKETWSWKDKF